MLYDKRWDTKIQQPSLVGLIAWLETQPGETEYWFINPDDCLVARYLKAIGQPHRMATADIETVFGERGYLAASRRPYTYKAALRRARGGLLRELMLKAGRAVSHQGF